MGSRVKNAVKRGLGTDEIVCNEYETHPKGCNTNAIRALVMKKPTFVYDKPVPKAVKDISGYITYEIDQLCIQDDPMDKVTRRILREYKNASTQTSDIPGNIISLKKIKS